MKALTVRQPWAWAIAAGVKGVENRTRGTSYRGPLAIHSGKQWSQRGELSPLIVADRGAIHERACHGRGIQAFDPETPEAHLIDLDFMSTLGAVIAVAELVDSHTASPEFEVEPGLWSAACCEDRYAEFAVYSLDKRDPSRDVVHLVLEHVVALDEPVPCRGSLGFWDVPADVAEVVDAQLAVSAS